MDKKKNLKIAVLMGGNSAERDVSLASGASVIAGLKQAGHDAIAIDTALGAGQITSSKINQIEKIKEMPPTPEALSSIANEMAIQTVSSPDLKQVDLVFIILHGGMGENGTIQALLDMVDIPYTGSGVLASALAMNKLLSKKVLIASGIPTPDYVAKSIEEINNEVELIADIEKSTGFPVVVKPNDQGSSVGLDIAMTKDKLFEITKNACKYSDMILFEKFIPGRELTVAVLGDKTLPIVEIRPKGGFYDYHHKYTAGQTEYLVPAPLTDSETKKVSELGLMAFKAAGCRGFARVDFRMNPEGEFFCLEINTLPGMTSTSLVPKAAKAAGIEFPQLLDSISQLAISEFERRKKI